MGASFGLFCAALCLVGPVPAAPAHETVTVHITMAFDPSIAFGRSIASVAVRTIAAEEATAIWRRYGVELVWSDPQAAALHLNVIVAPLAARPSGGRSLPILGQTVINDAGVVCGPIRISADAIRVLLQQWHAGRPPAADDEFARAVGRVLAHELGHVLLHRPHERDGLMRASFTGEDLARPDRRAFQLPDAAVRTLRDRF